MKKNIKNIVGIFLLAILATGCERFDFDKEVYKNVVYLLSDNDEFNIYDRAVANLDNDIDTVYITVGVSGSVGVPADIPVVLTPYYKSGRIVDENGYNQLEQDRLFYKYNKSRFDIKFSEWSSFLPETYYSFLENNRVGTESSGNVQLKTVIRKGTNKVVIPVIVKNLASLSPDSTYLMDYRIESTGDVEINQNKKELLIPIYWENRWTNTKSPISYDMYGEQFSWKTGTTIKEVGTERIITGSPILFPISKNEVRIAAGVLSIEKKDEKSAKEQIDDHSIILKVNDDNTVSIRSYKNLIVEEVTSTDQFYDPEYANKYSIEEKITNAGIKKYYKTFTLQYRYRLLEDNSNPFKKKFWVYVKSKLKYEFQPSAE